MPRYKKNVTLARETIEYLDSFGERNACKVIDEAIELHKNKDKQITTDYTTEKPKIKVRLIA